MRKASCFILAAILLLLIGGCSVSGKIEEDGTGLGGVELTLEYMNPPSYEPKETQTGNNGSYSFDVGTFSAYYIIRPSKEDYSFVPLEQEVYTYIFAEYGINFSAFNACEGETCWNGTVTIHSAEDLATLSGYTVLIGDLEVDGTSLPGLTRLESLEKIYGHVYIKNNKKLTGLDGLSGLTYISGKLVILNNKELCTTLAESFGDEVDFGTLYYWNDNIKDNIEIEGNKDC